jgi:hypothetical protein
MIVKRTDVLDLWTVSTIAFAGKHDGLLKSTLITMATLPDSFRTSLDIIKRSLIRRSNFRPERIPANQAFHIITPIHLSTLEPLSGRL